MDYVLNCVSIHDETRTRALSDQKGLRTGDDPEIVEDCAKQAAGWGRGGLLPPSRNKLVVGRVFASNSN